MFFSEHTLNLNNGFKWFPTIVSETFVGVGDHRKIVYVFINFSFSRSQIEKEKVLF